MMEKMYEAQETTRWNTHLNACSRITTCTGTKSTSKNINHANKVLFLTTMSVLLWEGKLTTNRLTLDVGFSFGCSALRDSNLALSDLVDSMLSCSESRRFIALLTDCFSGSQCSNFSLKDLALAAFWACF